MKRLAPFLLILTCYTGVRVDAMPFAFGCKKPAAHQTAATGAVRFQFKKIISSAKDSILIIFDRFDRTGAGIVYQVFAADSAQGISVPNVPQGKYFVTIQCVGLHRDRMEKKIVVKANKNATVKLTLCDCEEYAKDKVVIPPYQPDFSHMTVLR